jgi:hypothetical protein
VGEETLLRGGLVRDCSLELQYLTLFHLGLLVHQDSVEPAELTLGEHTCA